MSLKKSSIPGDGDGDVVGDVDGDVDGDGDGGSEGDDDDGGDGDSDGDGDDGNDIRIIRMRIITSQTIFLHQTSLWQIQVGNLVVGVKLV